MSEWNKMVTDYREEADNEDNDRNRFGTTEIERSEEVNQGSRVHT